MRWLASLLILGCLSFAVGCEGNRCRDGRCVREDQIPVRCLIDQPPVDTPIGEAL